MLVLEFEAWLDLVKTYNEPAVRMANKLEPLLYRAFAGQPLPDWYSNLEMCDDDEIPLLKHVGEWLSEEGRVPDTQLTPLAHHLAMDLLTQRDLEQLVEPVEFSSPPANTFNDPLLSFSQDAQPDGYDAGIDMHFAGLGPEMSPLFPFDYFPR